MKLAFSTLGCPDYTIDQAIDAAREYGYQGIGIRTVRGETYLPDLEEFSPPRIGELHRRFQESGIEAVCLSSGVKFTADGEERQKQIQDAEKYLDIAAALEAPFIRVFGGTLPENQGEDTDRADQVRERIAEGLRKAAELGAERGVTVLLENHDSFCTGRACRALLSRAAHDNLAVLWDILHSYRWGETPRETWSLIGDLIRHVHIKDASYYNAESFDIKLCGEGSIPIRETVNLLRQRGYSGYLSFEWEKGWHPEIPSASIAFPHYVSFMKDYVL